MHMSRSLKLCCLAFVAISLAAVHAQEEEEMGVTEEQAYAPITYNDGSSIDFQDKTLLSLTLEQNLGVWKAEGAQSPRGEFENPEGAMPNCTAYPNEFSFQHNVNDDQYLIYTAAPAGALQTSSGHRETSQSNVTSYGNNILNLDYAGSPYCQTWYPYLDRNTGLVKARTIYNGVYSMGADGEVSYTSLNCNATEPVIPGCFNEMGEDGAMTVRAASVFTWVCQQGECATQSPLYSQYDLAHPIDE